MGVAPVWRIRIRVPPSFNSTTACRFLRHGQCCLLSCMKKQIRILMVEDDPADAELIKFALRKDGLSFIIERVETSEDYLRSMAADAPDVILSDYSLPTFDGYSALALAQKMLPDVPFIF